MNPGGEHKSPKGLRYLVRSHQTRSKEVHIAAQQAFSITRKTRQRERHVELNLASRD